MYFSINVNTGNGETPARPAQRAAIKIAKRYYKKSPDKKERVRRALNEIEKEGTSVRKVASKFGLSFSYLQRRTYGVIDIDSRNGPGTGLSEAEEEAVARWLNEMSERGMGRKPGEFIDFWQDVVVKEKRKTPFVNGRPSYDCYVAFMARNSHIVEIRLETALESRRDNITRESIDRWHSPYRYFVIRLSLIDNPNRIYNESGFSL